MLRSWNPIRIHVDLQDSSEAATPSREEELAWSQKTIPNQTVEVADLFASTLQVAAPLVRSLGLQVERDIPEHLPRLDVQVVAVRQALLNVLTSFARQVPGGRMVMKARPQDETVLVQIMVEMRGSGDFVLERTNEKSQSMAEELVELSGGRLASHGEWRRGRPSAYPDDTANRTAGNRVEIDDNPDTLLLLQRYTGHALQID